MIKFRNKFFVILILTVSYPVFANAGIPMIGLIIPWFGISIIPVIIIEGYVIKKIAALGTAVSMKISTVANLITTILGIPITWVLLVLIQFSLGEYYLFENETYQNIHEIILNAAWLNPGALDSDLAVAGMIMLLPFFLVSYSIEYFIVKRFFAGVGTSKIVAKKAAFITNLITYSLFLVMLILIAVFSNNQYSRF
jgi:hypothetical protein